MNLILRTALLALAFATSAAHAQRLPVGTPDEASKELRNTPNRAYPPSCLVTPLPTAVRGTSVIRTVTLGGVDLDTGARFNENADIVIWREACSNGKGAVLVRVDRPASGTARKVPYIPEPFVTAGNVTARRVRIHQDPNTRFADDAGLPVVGDATFVLENFGTESFDFSQGFTLTLRTYIQGVAVLHTFAVPAYNAAQHPDFNRALEVNGYVSGSYFDPNRGGEGIVVEVGERGDGKRYVGYTWYTYDATGTPVWLVGNVDVEVGARAVTIPTLFIRGGGFAGNFNPGALDAKPWGNATLTFPSCGKVKLDYASAATPVAGAPTGNGTRTWDRAVVLNGFACE